MLRCNRVAVGVPSKDFGGSDPTADSKALDKLPTGTLAGSSPPWFCPVLDFFCSGLLTGVVDFSGVAATLRTAPF